MGKNLSAIILVGLFLCCGITAAAVETGDNDAIGKIVTDSLRFSRTTQFKGDTENPVPVKIENLSSAAAMQVAPLDRKITLINAKFKVKNIGDMEVLVNENGGYIKIKEFDWFGKLEYTGQNAEFVQMFSNFVRVNNFWYNVLANSDGIKYTMKEIDYDGRPCFEITATMPPTDKIIQLLTELTPQQIAAQDKNKLLANIPMLLTFIIDRDNSFCYSLEFYSTSGKQLGAADNWKNVTIGDIPPEAFYPPKDAEVIVFKSDEEFMQKVSNDLKGITKDESAATAQYGNYKKIVFYALGIICGILIAVLIIVKLKKR